MKRMFSKKGLVESSKEENVEDIDSDADLQEYVLFLYPMNLKWSNDGIVSLLLLKSLWSFLESGAVMHLKRRKEAKPIRK